MINIICKNCNKLKPHKAKGLCKSCYETIRSKLKDVCVNCKKVKRIHRKKEMLCYKCHLEINKSNFCSICEKLCVPYTNKPIVCKDCYKSPLISCNNCKKLLPHKAKGLCSSCYNKHRRLKSRICGNCGKLNNSGASLCSSCFHKKRNIVDKCSICKKQKLITKMIDNKPICTKCDATIGKCNKCGIIKPLQSVSKKICRSCYKPPLKKCDFCGNLGETSKIINNKRMCSKCYCKQPEFIAKVFNRRGDGEINKYEWLEIMKSNNWKCFYCDIKLNSKNRSIDHIIPIKQGGTNNKNNLVPCCRICNSSKNDLNVMDWLKNKGYEISPEKIKILRRVNGNFS